MFRKSIALLFVFLGALTLNAQNYSGGVAGTVTDPTGAVIAGAQITLKHVATDATRTTQSTSAGVYSFETLPIGTYELTVAASGFGAKKVTGVIIEAGRTDSIPVTLKVAAATTVTETVTANAVTLDTEETTQTAIIAPETMASVPLNGRDFTQLLKLVPGYANSANMSGTLNGGRTNTIDFQIDGVDNNDPWFATNAVNQGAQASIAPPCCPSTPSKSFRSNPRAALTWVTPPAARSTPCSNPVPTISTVRPTTSTATRLSPSPTGTATPRRRFATRNSAEASAAPSRGTRRSSSPPTNSRS
ncbi:MAG: carboxypeptidase regulatory-like domain-containing protein [Terracidiphilus sp.]